MEDASVARVGVGDVVHATAFKDETPGVTATRDGAKLRSLKISTSGCEPCRNI